MTSWRVLTLGEVVTLQRGHDLPAERRRAGSVPVMGSFGVTGHHNTAKTEGPGVIVGRSGASAGVVSFIDVDYWPLNTCLFSTNFHGNNPRYVFYLLSTLDLGSYNSGSAQPSLNRNYISPIPVSVPDRVEQDVIVGLLAGLDDKIELNRRMNETLEAMAQAIFRDWFVDFGPVRRKLAGETDPVAIMGGLTPDPARAAELAALFPAALDEGTGLPQGWREGNFGMLADTGGESVNPAQLGSDTPYIGLEHMPRRSIMLDSWDHAAKVSSQKSRFARGQVLFGKLRPYFHKVGIAPCNGVCSTDIVVLDSREPFDRALVASCASSDAFVAFTDQSSTGTKMPRTSWAHMKTYEMAIADEPARRAFEVVVGPMHAKVIASVAENRTLAETRDYLLPLLMSGRVGVGDLEEVAA